MNRLIPTHVPFWRTGPARSVLVIVVAVVLAQMVGCAPRTGDREGAAIDPAIYRDQLTGCDYLARGNGEGGLTPRMDRDGRQVCALVGAK